MNTIATVSEQERSAQKRQEITSALSNYDKPAIRYFQKNTDAPCLAHIPGDSGMPFLGHTYWIIKDIHAWMNKQHEKYGPVFKFCHPMGNSVFLLGPDANRLLFQNEDKIFSNFLAYDPTARTLLDNNLLERDFSDHKTQRKILQLAFKRPAIEGHMALMNPLLKNGISAWPTGRPIKAMPKLKKLLLDTGAKVFLGLEIGPEADKLNQAFIDILAGSADPFRKKSIWFSPYAKGVKGNKTLSTYVLKNIPERRKAEGQDFLTQFCQLKNDDGELFSDDEICDHIMFMLFAAHDTTTSALSSLMYALASNEDWQEQLRQEMLDLNKDELEFDDVAVLKKTGLTLKEALRMYPSVPMVPRYALEEFEFQGHRIPANSTIFGNSIFCHYMEEYWTKPLQFDPYRFSPERAEDKKDFYQYTPFGGGAHKCLGMHFAEVQVKMFLFYFLKSYKVSKNPKMTRYKYNNFPLTFPTDGLPLILTRL